MSKLPVCNCWPCIQFPSYMQNYAKLLVVVVVVVVVVVAVTKLTFGIINAVVVTTADPFLDS